MENWPFFWWTAGRGEDFINDYMFHEEDRVYQEVSDEEPEDEDGPEEFMVWMPKAWKPMLIGHQDDEGLIPVLNGAFGACAGGVVNGGPCFGDLGHPEHYINYSIGMHDLAREGLATPEGRYGRGMLCEGEVVAVLGRQLEWLLQEGRRPLLDFATCLPMVKLAEGVRAETGHWVEGEWKVCEPLETMRLCKRWPDGRYSRFLTPIDSSPSQEELEVYWWLSSETINKALTGPMRGVYVPAVLEEVARNKRCKKGEKKHKWWLEGPGGVKRAGGPLFETLNGYERRDYEVRHSYGYNSWERMEVLWEGGIRMRGV